MKRMGIFGSILLSYLIIALIPFAAFTLLQTNTISQTYQQKMMDGQRANLEHSMSLLDFRLNECRSIAMQISQNEYLSGHSIRQSTYGTSQAIDILEIIKGSNEFLGEVSIHYWNDDFMVTSNGVMGRNLLPNQLSLTDQEVEAFWEQLEEEQRTGCELLALRSNWQLCYCVSLPYNYSRSNGMAIFLLDRGALNGIFSQAKGQDQPMELIVTTDGFVLFSHNQARRLEEAEIAEILTSQEVALDGRKYYVMTQYSSLEPGLCMVLLSPRDALVPRFGEYIMLFLLTGGVLFVCLLLSTWFARRMWHPIRDLGSMVMPSDGERRLQWEPLKGAVQDTLAQKTRVECALEDYYQVMRENLLLRLVHGRSRLDGALRGEMKRLGLSEECTQACILAAQLPDTQYVDLAANVLEKFGNCIGVVETGAANCLVVGVFLRSGETGGEVLEAVASGIMTEMQRVESPRCTIGIGRILPLEQLRWSYLQARAALSERPEEPFHISRIYAAGEEPPALEQLKEKEMIFALALSQGNGELALQMVEESLNCALKNEPRMYCYVCSCLVSRLFRQMEEAGGSEKTRCWNHLAAHVAEADGGLFLEEMQEAVQETCEQVQAANRLREDLYIRSVEEFIRANYDQVSFSLDSLADEFGSTAAYWGRFVREKLGVSFLDLVWQLRLNRAKELLRETDRPVKEIVEQVGYLDARSFIRKFKSSEGLTPGQYRSMAQGNRAIGEQEDDHEHEDGADS